MTKHILVAYATLCGSTEEIAQVVGREISDHGKVSVDVREISEISHLGGYDAVVVGSPIRTKQWLPEAVGFLQTYQAELQSLPTAFFTVCLTFGQDAALNRPVVEKYLAPVHQIIQPKHEAFFAGKMELSKLPFLMGLIIRLKKAPIGDFRNWQVIQDWARSLRSVLAV